MRNALENHDPKETTSHLRDLAEKKRDERIMELWRNDLEKPSVYEMVNKMRKQHEEENKQSSKFIAMLNSIEAGQGVTPDAVPAIMDHSESIPTHPVTSANYSQLNVTSSRKPLKSGSQMAMSKTIQANVGRAKFASGGDEPVYRPFKAR